MFHNHRKSQALAVFCWLFSLCNVSYVRGTTCHCAWMEGPEYCYWLSEEYNDKKSWYDSKKRCETKGSVLGIVYSDAEKDWLTQQMLTRDFHWMGYTQTSTDDFRYIATNQTDKFIRDFAPVKGSKEEVRQDCAGVEKQSGSNDIWWRDKKCREKGFYICIAHKVTNNQSTTTKSSTISTTRTSQTTETVPEIQKHLHVVDMQRYKAKKPVTVPMSRDPVHVAAGISAIIILVAVIAFIVGNDVTSLLCKITFCAPEKKKLVKPKTAKLKSFVFNYYWQAETTEYDVNLWIVLKSYEGYIDVNGKITEFDEEAFQNVFIVQNGSKTDIWIKHMSLNHSKVDGTGSARSDTGSSVDGQPHNDPTILRILNQAQTSTKKKCLLLDKLVSNKASGKCVEQGIKDSDLPKSCKPLDTPIVATYVDPASKTAIKASYIGSNNSQTKQFDKSKGNDANCHSMPRGNQASPCEDTNTNSSFDQLRGYSSSCTSVVNLDGFLLTETTNSIRECVVENMDANLGKLQSDLHDESGYCDDLQSEK